MNGGFVLPTSRSRDKIAGARDIMRELVYCTKEQFWK